MLNLFTTRGHIVAARGSKRQNFPVFSRETWNNQTETGSPMTASTANQCSRMFANVHAGEFTHNKQLLIARPRLGLAVGIR